MLRLDAFTAEVVGDPEVNLSFSVQSGPDDTDFVIASALLDNFAPITDAEGYAHASYTLTDFDGGSATLTGVGDTGGAYLAQYKTMHLEVTKELEAERAEKRRLNPPSPSDLARRAAVAHAREDAVGVWRW